MDEWPLTGAGTVDLDRLPEPPAADEVTAEQPAAPWDEGFEELLRRVLPDSAHGGGLDPDAPLADAGLDSMATVGLMVAIEELYDLVIPDDFQIVDMFRTPGCCGSRSRNSAPSRRDNAEGRYRRHLRYRPSALSAGGQERRDRAARVALRAKGGRHHTGDGHGEPVRVPRRMSAGSERSTGRSRVGLVPAVPTQIPHVVPDGEPAVGKGGVFLRGRLRSFAPRARQWW
ncbi:phosphopantetheine-binding protein [Streptomyces sp. Tue 6430]|nr:phosphopantetheine-binding protein [Streptomyces sp. Tue 6430]